MKVRVKQICEVCEIEQCHARARVCFAKKCDLNCIGHKERERERERERGERRACMCMPLIGGGREHDCVVHTRERRAA